jgi:hypothetical protein
MTKDNPSPATGQWIIADDSDSFDDPLLDCLALLSSFYRMFQTGIIAKA